MVALEAQPVRPRPDATAHRGLTGFIDKLIYARELAKILIKQGPSLIKEVLTESPELVIPDVIPTQSLGEIYMKHGVRSLDVQGRTYGIFNPVFIGEGEIYQRQEGSTVIHTATRRDQLQAPLQYVYREYPQ